MALSEATGLDPETAAYLTKASGGELRSILAPGFRLLRLKIAVNVARKAARMLSEAGRESRLADLNVVVPLLEAASLQEDDEMSDRWAKLLANATDPEGSPVEPGFPDVLRQLSSNDARLMEHIVASARAHNETYWNIRRFSRALLLHSGPLKDTNDMLVSLDNLLRLRLLVSDPVTKSRPGREGKTQVVVDQDRFHLSAYGIKFAQAVSR